MLKRLIDGLFWPVVLGVLLTLFMLLNPPRALGAEVWRPWRLYMDLGGGQTIKSGVTFSSRKVCEERLSEELLWFSGSPLFIRTGECRADGWRI